MKEARLKRLHTLNSIYTTFLQNCETRKQINRCQGLGVRGVADYKRAQVNHKGDGTPMYYDCTVIVTWLYILVKTLGNSTLKSVAFTVCKLCTNLK